MNTSSAFRKQLTSIAMATIALVGLWWTWYSRPAGDSAELLAPATRVGAPAPPLTLPAPGGSTYTLEAFRGKVVVLNFWASWCLPCRAEMNALDKVNAELKDRGLVVLGVNQMESEATTVSFVRQQNIAFPIGLDQDGAASQTYHVGALPTTYFIDRDGVIREIVYGGPMTQALIESKVLPLLAK